MQNRPRVTPGAGRFYGPARAEAGLFSPCLWMPAMNAETRRRVDDLISRLRFLRDSL